MTKRKQVTIYIPEQIAKALKIEAIEQGKEMSQISEDAILDYLERCKDRRAYATAIGYKG